MIFQKGSSGRRFPLHARGYWWDTNDHRVPACSWREWWTTHLMAIWVILTALACIAVILALLAAFVS